MELEITKAKLKEVVGLAEKATGKNLSLPILSSILMEAKEGTLLVKATNLDIGLEVSLPAKVNEEGSVAINASTVGSFLSNLTRGEKIKLSTINDNVHIATDYSSTLIKSYGVEEFPIIPRVRGAETFTVPAYQLVGGLKSVVFAASLSDIKPEIASVYVYKDNNDLVFAATDSFRLAEKKVNVGRDFSFDKVIIPFRNVMEIIRVFDGMDEDVSIESDQNQISLYTDSIHLTSRLIDGVYPDYRQIIPKESTTTLVINKSELADALKLSTVFSDKFNQITFKIVPAEQMMEINAQNQDVGENTVSLKGDIKGEEITVSFNVRYILDSFQAIAAETVLMLFNGKNRPLLIKGMGDETFTYIVMPVNR